MLCTYLTGRVIFIFLLITCKSIIFSTTVTILFYDHHKSTNLLHFPNTSDTVLRSRSQLSQLSGLWFHQTSYGMTVMYFFVYELALIASFSNWWTQQWEMPASKLAGPECLVRSISRKEAFVSVLRWLCLRASRTAFVIAAAILCTVFFFFLAYDLYCKSVRSQKRAAIIYNNKVSYYNSPAGLKCGDSDAGWKMEHLKTQATKPCPRLHRNTIWLLWVCKIKLDAPNKTD